MLVDGPYPGGNITTPSAPTVAPGGSPLLGGAIIGAAAPMAVGSRIMVTLPSGFRVMYGPSGMLGGTVWRTRQAVVMRERTECPSPHRSAAANPFPQAVDDPKSLHFFFLADTASNPDLDSLEKLRARSERFELIQKVFYLHAPNGIGRSKLAASAERLIGVPATARNWRSIRKIVEMAREIQ